MACRVDRDANNNIVAVYAANGAKSLLYSDILDTIEVLPDVFGGPDVQNYTMYLEKLGFLEENRHSQDAYVRRKEFALIFWSMLLDKSYLEMIIEAKDYSLDINGEPKLSTIFATDVSKVTDVDTLTLLNSRVRNSLQIKSKEPATDRRINEILTAFPTVSRQDLYDYVIAQRDFYAFKGNGPFIEYKIDGFAEDLYVVKESVTRKNISTGESYTTKFFHDFDIYKQTSSSIYYGGVRYGIGSPHYEFFYSVLEERVKKIKDKIMSSTPLSTQFKILLDSNQPSARNKLEELLGNIDYYIITNHAENPYVTDLSKLDALYIVQDESLIDLYEKLTRILIPETEDLNYLRASTPGGTYIPSTRQIRIFDFDVSTIMHESLHEFFRAFLTPSGDTLVNKDTLSFYQKEFIRDVIKIYERSIDHSNSVKKYDQMGTSFEDFFEKYSYKGQFNSVVGYDGVEHYGLQDIVEFLNEALMNPTFQAYLKTLPSIGIMDEKHPNMSLFEEFLELIKRLFEQIRVSKDPLDKSLLDDFMFTFTKYLERSHLIGDESDLTESFKWDVPKITRNTSPKDRERIKFLRSIISIRRKINPRSLDGKLVQMQYLQFNEATNNIMFTLKTKNFYGDQETMSFNINLPPASAIEEDKYEDVFIPIKDVLYESEEIVNSPNNGVEDVGKTRRGRDLSRYEVNDFGGKAFVPPNEGPSSKTILYHILSALEKAFQIVKNDVSHIPVAHKNVKNKEEIIEEILRNDASPNTRLKKSVTAMASQLGVSVSYISEQSAKAILSLYGENLTDDRRAFFVDGKAFLIHGRSDMATFVHEVFHPMIEVIAATNRPLFEGLKKQITQEMFDEAADNVLDPTNEDDVYKEAMATFVGNYARAKDISMIDRVYLHLSRLFSAMKGSKVDINHASKLEDIADAVLEGTATFTMGEYIFETDKVFFETRKDTPILASILERSKKITKKEDHSAYVNNETKEEYEAVNSVIDKFTNKERYDKSLAEYLADKYWKNLPPTYARYTPDFPSKELTKEQYIKEKNLQMEYAIAKGKIQHLLRQAALSSSEAERSKLLSDAQTLGNSVGIPNIMQTFGWSIQRSDKEDVRDNLAAILSIEGVNIAEKLPEAVKDKMYSEVQVFSDVLGWGGTIDSFFEHVDGKFSIVDLTTGNSFNRTELNKLMQYGEQILSITDSPKNRKKLQVMLYALIVKAEHPDAEFRNLKVHWIPDIKEATRKNQDMDIDIQSYLGMIKSYLYNTNRKVYDRLIAKSPNIFDTSAYSDIGTDSIIKIMDTEEKGTTLKDIIANEQASLSRLINERDRYIAKHKKPAPYNIEESINKLTKSILEKKALAGMGSPLDMSRPDESMWKKLFGMFGDFADKKLQLFKQFLDERRFASDKEKANIRSQLEPITEKLRSEYLARSGGIGSLLGGIGIDNISYSEMYKNMIVTKTIAGTLTQQVLVKESDPEWDKLTATEKEFVRFISKKMAFYNEKVLKQVAFYTKDNKPVTYLQLVKKSNPNFKLEDTSFFPKLQMLKEELREHYDILSKDMLEQTWKRLQSDLFMVNTYTTEDRYGVPLKYYGTAELGDTGHWTRNLEYAFLRFTENLIDKIYMDEPLALGKGMLVLYSTDIGEDQKPRQKNNMEFLQDRLMLDILNTKEDTPMSRTGIRVPFINKRINEVAIFAMLRKLISSQIMWLKPVSGAANGVMANLITQRRAAVTSILGEGAFGLSDTEWALKEVAAMALDYTRGTLRENKLFILMKELNYLPSNFGYNTPSDELVTTKNKAFSTSHLYITHTFWEQQNALVVLAAQLHRMKTTKGGQSINMYDAYEVVEKTDDVTGVKYKTVEYKADTRGVVIKEGKKEELNGLTSEETARLKRVYQQMQGGYRIDERTTMETYWWGQLMLQFRKYLPAIVMSAVKSKSEDYTMGEYKLKRDAAGNIIQEDGKDVYEWVAMQTEGAFRVLVGAGVGFFTNYAVFKEYSWSQMSTQQKQVLIDSMLTLVAGLLMFAAFTAMFPDDDDDKDETKLLLMRVLENFTQHYNPLDWLHSLQTPPASLQRSVKALDASLQLMTALTNLGLGNEDKAYTRYGRLKGMTEIYKSIPIISSIYAFQKYITKTELTEDTEFGKWMAENIRLAL